MRVHFFVTLILLATMTAGAGRAEPNGCTFRVSPESSPPDLMTGPDTTARAWIMAQADSPLAIRRADLTGLNVNGVTGSFTRSGRHVVEVKNVSDAVITDARVSVHVGFSMQSGIASGSRISRPLQPGDRAVLDWKSASGRGSIGADDDVSIVVLVTEVTTPGCTYRPSQSWPSRAAPGSPAMTDPASSHPAAERGRH
jgi:hypothetical protein